MLLTVRDTGDIGRDHSDILSKAGETCEKDENKRPRRSKRGRSAWAIFSFLRRRSSLTLLTASPLPSCKVWKLERRKEEVPEYLHEASGLKSGN